MNYRIKSSDYNLSGAGSCYILKYKLDIPEEYYKYRRFLTNIPRHINRIWKLKCYEKDTLQSYLESQDKFLKIKRNK